MAAAENSDVTADVSADCLSKDEVVNCICQLNEENGLMIQVFTVGDVRSYKFIGRISKTVYSYDVLF